MEHARKMILVPQDFASKLNQIQTSPKPSSSLDSEMESLLNNNQMDDREKWMKYQQVLQRYLHFKEQDRKPLEISLESNITESLPKPLLHQEVIAAVPKLFRKKAEMLLNRLATSDSITWNAIGEVTINGDRLVGSNITDLVGDMVRPRKTSNPTGWQKFTDMVRELNVPREFIGNPRRILYMERELSSTPRRHQVQRVQVRSSPLTRVVTRQRHKPSPLGWRSQQQSSSEEEPRETMWERYKFRS